MSRHRILPLPAPWVATREPLQPEPAPAQQAVAFHRLEKIGGAGRMKAATRGRPAEPREEWRKGPLVGADEETNEQHHRQRRRIEARFVRRNHSSSSAAELARAAAGRAITTSHSPLVRAD